MRGQVLGVDKRSGEGQISGEDGNRYTFTPDDWSDARGPAAGVNVDFATQGSRALKIFHEPGGVATLAPHPVAAASGKNRIAAALLAFFLGMWGIHKFYLGKPRAGMIMLLCGTIGWVVAIPGLFATVTALIECVIYLVTDDEAFERNYVKGDKAWF